LTGADLSVRETALGFLRVKESDIMRTHPFVLAGFSFGVALAGCATTAARPEGASAPLFHDIGHHRRAVTTSSGMAQRYFDQGLTWTYAFNHDEAIRSFRQATELDPECAMAWWGIALCNGPHINNPVVPPERAEAAWAALQNAVAAADNAGPTERALIGALQKRYANPQPEDRAPLDQAYADAMAVVWQSHRSDPDVGTLYAEALMDLRPWDLWTREGQPQPGTEHVLGVLEDVLRLDPYNPGANHLYIHAVEASPQPERANAAADRLRDMVPVSGHLLHMPSHIDVLTGRWDKAVIQNEKAIRADAAYRGVSPKQGFYHIYMLHNRHMLAFAAMMEGRSRVAIRAAGDVVSSVPEDYGREAAAFVDAYMCAKYDALKRFGRWDALLHEPAPPTYWPITTAHWHFNRGLAYAAMGEVDAALRERDAFESAAARIPEEAVAVINPAHDILRIARNMFDAEIEFRRGNMDESVVALRRAIEIEDALLYMEPPEWAQPVRHTLGAVLLSAGRYAEAEQVYREDLADWPGNGWSLYGLSRALHLQEKGAEALEVDARFREAWSRADIQIGSSCLCVPKT